MDGDSWSACLSSASRRYQSALQSLSDMFMGFEDIDGEDHIREEFPCAFCSEYFDIVGLCCHIDDEHPPEAKNGVCPVCSMREGVDMVAHRTLQRGNIFKAILKTFKSECKRKRKSRKGGSHSTHSLLRRELREGNLQSLFGGSCIVSSSNSAPDPLLSSFIFPMVDDSVSVQPRLSSKTGRTKKSSDVNKSKSFKLHASKTYGVGGGYSRRGTRRPMTTKADGRNKTKRTAKPSGLVRKILDEKVPASTALNLNKISESQQLDYCGIQQMIAEDKDIANLVTFIVYDTETTGLSRKDDRIIEIALQDLSEGEYSTFQTLVNPGCYVANSHVHGITTKMVRRPDVPRMEELIPILLQFVESRHKPGGYVLFGAHNNFSFDLPFLINEFSRCSYEIPSNWLFMDTLPLARELMKSGGSDLPSGASLQAIREHYGIPLVGSAHRAMSDVRTLAMIVPMLMFDLKLSLPNLVSRSSTALQYINNKRKKN